MRTAILLGSSGLVGGHCLEKLLQDSFYDKVRILVRKPSVSLRHPKLEQSVCDFERLEDYRELFYGNELFCCLGTTLRAARSKEAFFKVDHDYVLSAARIAAEQGVQKFLLVSSKGAHPQSPSFYLRVKGQLEKAVQELPFQEIHIFRPSFLKGERKESRFKEKLLLKVLSPLEKFMTGPLTGIKPIAAEKLADALIRVAKESYLTRIHIYESEEIQKI